MVMRLCLVVILALSGCAGGDEDRARPQAPSSALVSPRPIVVDTDLGADDIIALALLLRSPAVDVRAITVSGTVSCDAPSAPGTCGACSSIWEFVIAR